MLVINKKEKTREANYNLTNKYHKRKKVRKIGVESLLFIVGITFFTSTFANRYGPCANSKHAAQIKSPNASPTKGWYTETQCFNCKEKGKIGIFYRNCCSTNRCISDPDDLYKHMTGSEKVFCRPYQGGWIAEGSNGYIVTDCCRLACENKHGNYMDQHSPTNHKSKNDCGC